MKSHFEAQILPRQNKAGLFANFAFVLCAFFAARTLAAAPQVNGSTESGAATVVFQFNQSSNRDPIIWTGPFYSIAIPTTSNANLHIDSKQWLANVGTFEFSLDLNEFSFDWNDEGAFLKATPSRGYAGVSDLHLGPWSIQASAGDVMFDVYNLDFGLSSLYRPNVGLRGFQLDASQGKMHYSIFGGRTTASTGYFGESELVSKQSVIGTRAVAQMSEKFTLGMSFLHISEPENTNQSASWVTDSLTISGSYRFNRHLQFVGETAIAQYRQTLAGDQRRGYDLSGLLGAKVQSDRLSADVSLMRLGPTYAPFSYTSLGDRAGISGSGNYRISDRLSLYGSYNHWHNNVLETAGDPTVRLNHQYLGGNYRIATGSTLGARIGFSGMNSSSNSSRLTSSRMKNIYLDFSQHWRAWRFTVRGNEIRSTEEGSVNRRGLRRRLDMEIRRRLHDNIDIWASGGVITDKRESFDRVGLSQSSLAGSTGINWTLRPWLSFYSEASWNQELSALSALTVDNAAIFGGLNWQLPRDIRVGVEGRYSRDASELNMLSTMPFGSEAATALENFLRGNRNNDYQITFHIQKILKWGKRPAVNPIQNSEAPSRPRSFGSIEGIVFEDLDNDGTMDAGEKGVTNVTIILDNQERIVVDEAGRFAYKTVETGAHTVALELITIPAYYSVGPQAVRTVGVIRKHIESTQFPLVRVGKIQGKVMALNAPGLGTNGDEGILARERKTPEMSVLILLNNGFKATMTDSDGEFEFASLPAGEYNLQVQDSSLPNNWVVTSAWETTVSLAPGGRVSGIEFLIEAKPRPNRRILTEQIASPPLIFPQP